MHTAKPSTRTRSLTIDPNRRRRRAIHLTYAVDIDRPRDSLFAFLLAGDTERYRKLARGHQRFDVQGGGPLREGAVIDCRERAGNQEVHHEYVVTEVLPGARIAFASVGSKSFVHSGRRVITSTSNTFVYYDLAPLAKTRTRLTITIVIQLPSLLWKVLALLSGTRRIWTSHMHEEMESLARLASFDPVDAVWKDGAAA